MNTAAGSTATMPARDDQRPTHVLNVDDDEAALYAKTRFLEVAGFIVSEARTGEQALALARGSAPDIVLLDTRLPDIDGFEVCRRLKGDPATATILVVQTSAQYVLASHKARALDGGADNFLVEPVTQAELVACVRAMARLATVERALRAADGRKNEFLATLAHELRNPLGPLRNAVEVLQRQPYAAASLPARAVDAAVRQTRRLTGLVEDLMDVARLKEDKLDVCLAPVNARTLLAQVAEAAAPALAGAGQALDVDLPHPALHVDGDHARLLKIFVALLDNAAKYSEPGKCITLRAATHDGSLLVQVADDGIGIAADRIDAIFELFVQAGHRAGRVKDGLGVGLALARAILARHRGSIVAFSKGPGHGSVFEVCLPLTSAVPAAAPASAADPVVPARALQVLLVDDNADATDMLAVLLELKGYIVRTAAHGAAALASVQAARPDIAILDIGLPDMSGHELARAIRATTGDTVPVVALSGNAVRSDGDPGVFDRLLDKPVGTADLLAVIGELAPPGRS